MKYIDKIGSKKVILAYSGGLDTSVLIPWLKENGVEEVICAAGNVGQVKDEKALEERAMLSGASKFYCLDLKDEFIKDYVYPCIKAGAKYEGVYLLGTAMARPLIAKALVELAKKENTNVIVHGCTGKGNDQVRFELTIQAIAPEIKVVAPWRFWDIVSRSQEIEFVKKHNIPLEFSEEESYSMDENIWHLSHEGLDLENPKNPANMEKILKWINPLEKTPDTAEEISIGFVKGEPCTLNGKEESPLNMVTKLNEIGAKHGIGVDDIVENRLVGMKSRGVYENPAGSILYYAHEKLESLTLDKDTMHFKQPLSYKYADMVYNGKWENPLFKALNAFVDSTQENVSGTVHLKLYKGNIIINGIESENSLFSEAYATFEEDSVYDHSDASGFIKLYGLSTRIRAELLKK